MSLAQRPGGPTAQRVLSICRRWKTVYVRLYWEWGGRCRPLAWTPHRGRVYMPIVEVLREYGDIVASRPDLTQLPSLRLLGAGYGSWDSTLPTLASWVCDACYDDASPKGQTTLTLKRDGSVVQAMLKVEDGGLCLRGSGDTPEDALVALELLLTASKVPWEADRFPLGGQPKKSKK